MRSASPPWDRRGMKSPATKRRPLKRAGACVRRQAPLTGRCAVAGRFIARRVSTGTRRSWMRSASPPWDRRGMKSPATKRRPLKRAGACVRRQAPLTGRCAVAGRFIARRVSTGTRRSWMRSASPPWDRRGMKSPGYKAAPVETGWRVCATASPVDGALRCSRAIYTCTCAGAQRRCMCRPAVVARRRRCMKTKHAPGN